MQVDLIDPIQENVCVELTETRDHFTTAFIASCLKSTLNNILSVLQEKSEVFTATYDPYIYGFVA